ncbi:MAG: STAS domain-containing protein [Prevotella sp.]|nr:STAS domain-containing protein [Prevotella sp.]
MTLDIKEHEGGMTAIFIGRLDTPSAVKAQQEIVPLLENADKEIILDCEQLQYISSSGLRLFLAIRKEVSAKGGKVIVENINDDIKKVFMMTGFIQLFEVR